LLDPQRCLTAAYTLLSKIVEMVTDVISIKPLPGFFYRVAVFYTVESDCCHNC
jgi:hypothetical protein